jgi:hypothetical protein
MEIPHAKLLTSLPLIFCIFPAGIGRGVAGDYLAHPSGVGQSLAEDGGNARLFFGLRKNPGRHPDIYIG